MERLPANKILQDFFFNLAFRNPVVSTPFHPLNPWNARIHCIVKLVALSVVPLKHVSRDETLLHASYLVGIKSLKTVFVNC